MFPDSMASMAETFGKRQRGEAKVKRREAKEERRAARKVQRQVPTSDLNDEHGDLQQPNNRAID